MTTEIEKTKRALYECLDRIRRAGKHRVLTAEFEERMEEYLEELRLSRVQFTESRQNDLERRLAAKIEECDQVQQRLHAIDHAYNEQSKEFDHARSNMAELAIHVGNLETANRVSGEELIRVQGIARQYLDDCRSAEKLSDEFSEKLTHATTVIGQQERLIAGQRHAIAEMFGLKNRKTQAVKCAHEFHPAFPGGERCVYCLEEKLTPAAETLAQMQKYRSELCTNPAHHQLCKCGRG